MPSRSTDVAPHLDGDGQRQLLAIARAAIADHQHEKDAIELEALPAALRCRRAVFVTLTRDGRLRGCIGSLVATAPLARAVADAARGAAYRDPRFPAVRDEELADIRIEISVLSPLEPIAADSRRALIASLRPGVDGLLLEEGTYRSTFLPKVWNQLPGADDFLSQLLIKAGLPADYWSPGLRARRYTASDFAEVGDSHRS